MLLNTFSANFLLPHLTSQVRVSYTSRTLVSDDPSYTELRKKIISEPAGAINCLPVNCWSLSIGFSVVCHVPQMFACSSDMVSEGSKREKIWCKNKETNVDRVKSVDIKHPIISNCESEAKSSPLVPQVSAPGSLLQPATCPTRLYCPGKSCSLPRLPGSPRRSLRTGELLS